MQLFYSMHFLSIGAARENMFFYSFVLFLIAGVNGSFLNGRSVQLIRLF